MGDRRAELLKHWTTEAQVPDYWLPRLVSADADPVRWMALLRDMLRPLVLFHRQLVDNVPLIARYVSGRAAPGGGRLAAAVEHVIVGLGGDEIDAARCVRADSVLLFEALVRAVVALGEPLGDGFDVLLSHCVGGTDRRSEDHNVTQREWYSGIQKPQPS